MELEWRHARFTKSVEDRFNVGIYTVRAMEKRGECKKLPCVLTRNH